MGGSLRVAPRPRRPASHKPRGARYSGCHVERNRRRNAGALRAWSTSGSSGWSPRASKVRGLRPTHPRCVHACSAAPAFPSKQGCCSPCNAALPLLVQSSSPAAAVAWKGGHCFSTPSAVGPLSLFGLYVRGVGSETEALACGCQLRWRSALRARAPAGARSRSACAALAARLTRGLAHRGKTG
jgi:hypothetical protein